MASKREKRERFFERGAAALEKLNPEWRRLYACPICTMLFTEESLDDGSLTLDHAPPRSVGGRVVALTCKDCNSTAGYTVEREVRRLEDVKDFARAKVERPLHVRFQVPGAEKPVNVKVQGAGGYFFGGLPKNNHPRVHRQWAESFEKAAREGTWDGFQFQITLPGVDMRKARIGYLRSAYLIAFAALGYRFALSPSLDAVRKQLLDVDSKLLEKFYWTLRNPKAEGRHLVIMEKPVVSLCVQFDRTVIMLPGRSDEEEFYKDLQARFKGDLSVREIAWPRGLKLALDFS